MHTVLYHIVLFLQNAVLYNKILFHGKLYLACYTILRYTVGNSRNTQVARR